MFSWVAICLWLTAVCTANTEKALISGGGRFAGECETGCLCAGDRIWTKEMEVFCLRGLWEGRLYEVRVSWSATMGGDVMLVGNASSGEIRTQFKDFAGGKSASYVRKIREFEVAIERSFLGVVPASSVAVIVACFASLAAASAWLEPLLYTVILQANTFDTKKTK